MTVEWKEVSTAPVGKPVLVKGFYDYAAKEVMRAHCAVRQADGVWFRDNSGYSFTVQCFPTHWENL